MAYMREPSGKSSTRPDPISSLMTTKGLPNHAMGGLAMLLASARLTTSSHLYRYDVFLLSLFDVFWCVQ